MSSDAIKRDALFMKTAWVSSVRYRQIHTTVQDIVSPTDVFLPDMYAALRHDVLT